MKWLYSPKSLLLQISVTVLSSRQGVMANEGIHHFSLAEPSNEKENASNQFHFRTKKKKTVSSRRLSPTCIDKALICSWDGPGIPRYAVCDSIGKTHCVDDTSAIVGMEITGGKGKGKANGHVTVESCGCCSDDYDRFCRNGGLPVWEPICDFGDFSCGGESVEFCYFDLSRNKLKTSCGGPYDEINFEDGNTFKGCGEDCLLLNAPSSLPSGIPSLQPSSQPSSGPSNMPSSQPSFEPSSTPSMVPTDSCLACGEGDPAFYFSPIKLNFDQHALVAAQMGCSLARVTLAEQSAAAAALRAFGAGPLSFTNDFTFAAFIGGISDGASPATYTWVDGSGTITDGEIGGGAPVDTPDQGAGAWAPNNPNQDGPTTLGMTLFDGPSVAGMFTVGDYNDVGRNSVRPALYKCCNRMLDFSGCTVPSPY